jgi:hypothetical protein
VFRDFTARIASSFPSLNDKVRDMILMKSIHDANGRVVGLA